MQKVIITTALLLVLGGGIVSPAQASPAAPTFFEGISEWFGDVFTFGDLAKAERDIKKAETIFQNIDAKRGSRDDFIKSLIRYEKRIENAKLHFENAKQKGKDVSSLRKTIADTTDYHIKILEAGNNQSDDKAKDLGLLRALEVVKDANARAREAIGQALEKKAEKEQEAQKPETSGTQPPTKDQNKTQSGSSVPFVGGLWKIEKGFSFDGSRWKEETVPGGAHAYLEFKSDGRICGEWTILPKPSCRRYETYTVSGDIIKITEKGVTAPQRFRWSIKEGKLEIVIEIPDGSTWKPALKTISVRAKYPSSLPQKKEQGVVSPPEVAQPPVASKGYGTITIRMDADYPATVTISGPATKTVQVTGGFDWTSAPAGTYTITYGNVEGYETPPPDTGTLNPCCPMNLYAHYIKKQTTPIAPLPIRPRVVSVEVFPTADNQITGRKQIEIRCHGVSDEEPIVEIDIKLLYPGYKSTDIAVAAWGSSARPLDTSNPKDQVWAALFDVETPSSVLPPPKYAIDGVYTASCLSRIKRHSVPFNDISIDYFKPLTLP